MSLLDSGGYQDFFNDEAKKIIALWNSNSISENKILFDSISYSFLKGGKRFRPTLCLMISDTYAVGPRRVLPWATAIEMIHTYSLIHDDLPCMDNDDLRRGEPTNHKVYGESIALLAGDSLLTEAFFHIAEAYKNESDLGLKLVKLLSRSAGLFGMVGGQMIDINFKNFKYEKPDEALRVLEKLHRQKTGALIEACAEGSALICGLPQERVLKWKNFGSLLGLAFQIKDDLLDAKEKHEPHSYPGLIGELGTQKLFAETSQKLNNLLHELGLSDSLLHQLVEFNISRSH